MPPLSVAVLGKSHPHGGGGAHGQLGGSGGASPLLSPASSGGRGALGAAAASGPVPGAILPPPGSPFVQPATAEPAPPPSVGPPPLSGQPSAEGFGLGSPAGGSLDQGGSGSGLRLVAHWGKAVEEGCYELLEGCQRQLLASSRW